MNKKSSRNILQFIITPFVFYIVRFSDLDMLTIPLLALCASDSACGNTGGGDPGGTSSTPFFCTWNGKKFVFENDILFGKPTSLFDTEEAGRYAYEHGFLTGDLYKINNTIVPQKNSLAFQIKEVEPEESFMDYFSLLRVTHPRNGELIVDSSYENMIVFEKDAIDKKEGVENQKILNHNGSDITERFSSIIKQPAQYEMETGDFIEVGAIVKNINRPLYLLLGSQYRDWTLGDVFTNTNYDFIKDQITVIASESKNARSFIAGIMKISGLSLLLLAVWIFGGMQSKFASNYENNSADLGKLASAFGTPAARADTPTTKSLVVEYSVDEKNWKKYHRIDVVQPRHYQQSLEAILIPPQAIQESGEISLRITSTKRHNVTHVSLLCPEKLLPFQVDILPVKRAYHHRTKKDYAKVLNERGSKEYLHAIPADIIDLEFDTPVSATEHEEETYLVRAHGFYTPLSPSSQTIAGDWVKKLDPEARQWLKEMYSLKDYHNKNRTKVL